MPTDVMIEAKNLTKRYGAFRALDKVSFQIERGEVVGFLGPNGAGKSTTMRILTCFLSATGGTAKVHGHDVFEEPLEVRKKIGYLPQRAQMYGEMGVLEYLRFVAELRKVDDSAFRKRMKEIVEICGLSQVLGKDIRQLSHGFRQRVGLAQALLHNPPILILDEPTSDLDPNERAEVIEYIREIGKDRTVILSTHNLAEVEAACARAIIVSKGRVVADGNLDDVRARSGRVRYRIVIDEQKVLGSGGASEPPTADEVEAALESVDGALKVHETPTDERSHAFELTSMNSVDLRAELYQLCVAKGWLMLEMRRDVQKLEDVFKALTRGDEAADRGRKPTVDPDVDDALEDYDDEDLDDEDLDDEDDEDLDDDLDDEDEEDLDDEDEEDLDDEDLDDEDDEDLDDEDDEDLDDEDDEDEDK